VQYYHGTEQAGGNPWMSCGFPQPKYGHIPPGMNVFCTQNNDTPAKQPTPTVTHHHHYHIMSDEKVPAKKKSVGEDSPERFQGVLSDEALGSMVLPVPVSSKKGNPNPHEIIVIDSDDSDKFRSIPDSAFLNINDPQTEKPAVKNPYKRHKK
jgi:hypothetical protein